MFTHPEADRKVWTGLEDNELTYSIPQNNFLLSKRKSQLSVLSYKFVCYYIIITKKLLLK